MPVIPFIPALAAAATVNKLLSRATSGSLRKQYCAYPRDQFFDARFEFIDTENCHLLNKKTRKIYFYMPLFAGYMFFAEIRGVLAKSRGVLAKNPGCFINWCFLQLQTEQAGFDDIFKTIQTIQGFI